MIRTTARRARRFRRCESGCMIEPGRVYLEHVLSPQEDAASGRWLRVAECAWHADAHKRSDLINARNST
jgi:hypothetical protein